MAGETAKVMKLSELIGSSRPLTGAHSLISSPTIPNSQNSDARIGPNQGPDPDSANPNPKVLKSLSSPAILTGTLNLPPHSDSDDSDSKCPCFQFSDGSATVCCDILRFDPKIIGEKIRILAWNFIPLRHNCGFLEIIRWDFVKPQSFSVSGTYSLFSGSSINSTDNAKARCFMTGAVESVSLVSVVPCTNLSNGEGNVSISLRGFLVKMLVCKCRLCSCKYSKVELQNSNENTSSHCFNEPVIAYFCGPASVWHPVITKLVGGVVTLLGMKKKLVYIGKEGSQLMYVTEERSSMHMSSLPDQFVKVQKTDIRGNGESGSYSGIVTGVYMQGMIVELDRKVMLLSADHRIAVPHSLRVGAIVSLKNVHFVNPRFYWSKCLILGSCIKTSISVKSFSSLETGCFTKPQHKSLLSKFIDSLTLAARLWVLLVVASLKRKFWGTLSIKEILGTKTKEGLAQLYAKSHLPASVFSSKHEMFTEFCKHGACTCNSELNYFRYSLAVPFSNLMYYCESIWMKLHSNQEGVFDIMGTKDKYKSVSCGGRDHVQIIRRAVHSDDLGVALVGFLKISASSGRLQLVDATGGIDVVPDISLNWNLNRIYEVKRFTLIMEGTPEKMDHFSLLRDEPFMCQNIFTSGPSIKETNMSLHLSYNVADKTSIDNPFSGCINMKETFQELEMGKFHLLWVKHKFPIQQKYQLHQGISSNLSAFAEVLVLPWDLHIAENNGDALTAPFPHQFMDSIKYLSRVSPHKKQKIGHPSREYCNITCLPEFPCLLTCRRGNLHRIGKLQCNNINSKFGFSRPELRKALLEFNFEALSLYEALKIGCYYIVKHQQADKLCTATGGGKVLLNSGTHIWSLTFSAAEVLQNPNSSSISPQGGSTFNNNVVSLEGNDEHQIHTDVNLFLSSDFISLLEDEFKLPKEVLINSLGLSQEETKINFCSQSMVTAYQRLPEGNLVSLCGRVHAIHYLHEKSLSTPLKCHSGARHSTFFENKSICVHLLVDGKMVRIFGASYKHAFPAGFGKGVTAIFHRIFVLSGQESFKLIPASFISVHTRSEIYDEFNTTAVDSLSVAPRNDVPKALICEIMHCSKNKPMQFRCRVVAVYVLVLENKEDIYYRQNMKSESSSCLINIPLAGFVLDDGSSCCCCWANCEHAAALLGLHSKVHCEVHGKSHRSSRKNKKEKKRCSIECRLDKLIKCHERVVVKNHGSSHDLLFQDLTFSVNSDHLISSSDDEFLRLLILKASSSNTLNVVASLMNSEATKKLEKHLNGLGMMMPQMRNVWALGVDRVEPLAEARSIFQELVHNTK